MHNDSCTNSKSNAVVVNSDGAVSPSTMTTTTGGSVVSEANSSNYQPSKWDIWMLGITIVIGGQYFCWNAGLAAGLYSYMIAFFLIASAYVAMCCCTSEITSTTPSASGAYGVARCTLGLFPAFMIGCCETLEYVVYVSTAVLSFADMVVHVQPSLKSLRPLVWALCYVSALCFHLTSDRVFWVFNRAIGAVSLAIVLLFCVGSLPYVDFATYAHQDAGLHMVDGVAGFMKVLPLAAWFFVGVEALNLSSDQVAQPKAAVPFAQVTCVLTLLATGVMVFFVTVSLPPGLAQLPTELVPFNNGFVPLFGLSASAATLLSLPATYATAFGFIWCYGKLICEMATSRLLPPFLAHTSSHRHASSAPFVAVIAGSVLSYACCLLVYLVPAIAAHLYSICMVFAFLAYSGQCVGYIALKRSYRNSENSRFQSPFGVMGAVYSIAVWLLGVVSIAGFQGNGGVEIGAFGVVAAALTVFYVAYARKRQLLAPHANSELLTTHVLKLIGKRPLAKRNSNTLNQCDATVHTVGPLQASTTLSKATTNTVLD